MITQNGKIAFHSYLMREDGGLDYVQYDFDGKELWRKEVRQAFVPSLSENP